ncbi:MAG: leucine-rich repeat protein, partial [Cenarchaeum sp. SB0669_bin_11]|nr:leucine-rich repeat protein [Cenarchaeum sp. SB0669_bin_11]
MAEPFECEEVADPLPSSHFRSPIPQNAISSTDLSSAGAATRPMPQADDLPTEDGSEIRVLVVYTPAREAAEGGVAGIRALIDLFIQSANQAFEDSGINPRLVLARAAKIDYVETGRDLHRLVRPDDGHLDEVHSLRNEHTADLVHLLSVQKGGTPLGSAKRMASESLLHEKDNAFAVTASSRERTFTHEIGHNFGVGHDRYQYPTGIHTFIYPFAFGYVNKSAFEPGAPETARWQTVMAYPFRCGAAGLSCESLLRFSNPDQSHLGDALGVSADSTTTGVNGPADARLTINRTARWVGSFRSEACSNFTVSQQELFAGFDGGEVTVEVAAAPGCVWEAVSQSEFLSIASDERSAGSGIVSIRVSPNRSGGERNETVTVAGKTITVRQPATSGGICGRSTAVIQTITSAAGYSDVAQCDQVTGEDLARIATLSLADQGIGSLKAGDFGGLSNLKSLDLRRNQLTELPEDLFAGLSNLQTISFESNRLRQLPARLFAGLASLEQLNLFGNELAQLPEGLFAGLSRLESVTIGSNRISSLPGGLFAGLSNLKLIKLSVNDIVALQAGLFTGLSSLERMDFRSNEITELPAGLFSGLSRLESLDLSSNRIMALPDGSFADLRILEELNLNQNRITDLTEEQLSGLSNVAVLRLSNNRLTKLPEGLFAGLGNLNRLDLCWNQLSQLPPGILSGLIRLTRIDLCHNRLSQLPPGLFNGLTALETIDFSSNAVSPLPLSLSLEKVGESQIKAVVQPGAPSALVLPISVSSAGEIEGGMTNATIPAGASESALLEIVRVTGSRQAASVDIGNIPKINANHTGYSYARNPSLPIRVLPSLQVSDARLADLSLSEASLDPAFSAGTLRYTAVVGNRVAEATVTPTASNADAAVAFLDANDSPLADVDGNKEGHQMDLQAGENTIKVRVTSEDSTASQTYTLVVTRDSAGNICGRTEQVREAILEAIGTVDDCSNVSEAQLKQITLLNLTRKNLQSLKSGDFEGMTSLDNLWLSRNQLTVLPDDIFSRLSALKYLSLDFNQFTTLPESVFSELTALQELNLRGNRFAILPAGVFSGLSALEWLGLAFSTMDTVTTGNFSNLTSLKTLELRANRLTSLPSGAFTGLSMLETLDLGSNRLTSLPGDVFAGLSSLQDLDLYRNQFSSLPDGLFSGLNALESLTLEQNPVDPIPFQISLEKVGDSQLKAVMPIGAPFAIEVPVSISGAGELANDADKITIPAGAVNSAPLLVTRLAGTTAPVTADIGLLPGLPASHSGYVLQKGGALPQAILPSTSPMQDASLRYLAVGEGALEPSFVSGTTSYAVVVANAVSSITFSPTASNQNAAVAYLDASDGALADADTSAGGHQVNLDEGENNIKIQVTSEDGTQVRNYTIMVNRNRLPEITSASSLFVNENDIEVVTLSAS